MLRNQDKPMIAFVLQSARKKDFAIAKVREDAAGGQMPRLSKEFEGVKSFSLLKRKISLISTLVHRALMICTKRRLNEEIERIKKILLYNGYPKNIINTQITKKIA